MSSWSKGGSSWFPSTDVDSLNPSKSASSSQHKATGTPGQVGSCIVPYSKQPAPVEHGQERSSFAHISAMCPYSNSSQEELRHQDYSAGVKDSSDTTSVFGQVISGIGHPSAQDEAASDKKAAPWQNQVVTGGGFDALLSGPGFPAQSECASLPAFTFASPSMKDPGPTRALIKARRTAAKEQGASLQGSPTTNSNEHQQPQQPAGFDIDPAPQTSQERPACEQQPVQHDQVPQQPQQEQQQLLQDILNKLSVLSTAGEGAHVPASSTTPAPSSATITTPAPAAEFSGYLAGYAAGYSSGHAAGFSAGMAAAQTMLVAQLHVQRQQPAGLLHAVPPSAVDSLSAPLARGTTPAVQGQQQQVPLTQSTATAPTASTTHLDDDFVQVYVPTAIILDDTPTKSAPGMGPAPATISDKGAQQANTKPAAVSAAGMFDMQKIAPAESAGTTVPAACPDSASASTS